MKYIYALFLTLARAKVNINMRFAAAALMLATSCFAQEGFMVENRGKQKWPADEAQKIYLSACAVVQREFGLNHPVRPQFKLILGAEKNKVSFEAREIQMIKWDPYTFADGVVLLAFQDLMSPERKTTMTIRVVRSAESVSEMEPAGQ